MKARFAALAAACLALWLADIGRAYWLSGPRWPSGAGITMQLQLGASSGTLIDGSSSWNPVAEGALATWNTELGNVSFRVVRDSTAGIALSNGLNNVFWDDDVYGESFGDAIAYTKWLYRTSDNAMIEADVVFDRNLSWNSYRGNLRRASNGTTLYDLRRVALHEFGHVLGLGHPDEHGQAVTALMNTHVSNLDSLQTDDTSGAHAMYGSGTTPPAPTNHAPTVTASCSPCTVQAGQTSTLRATASDPDGDSLTYQWTAPQGSFSTANASTTAWTAPAQSGTVVATITVQDGRGGRATADMTLEVVPRDRLQSPAALSASQSLVSTNLRYRLLYQSDGNLVLNDDSNKVALWSTGTAGTTTGQLLLQGDGNLVIYDARGVAVWATGTAGNLNAILLVQNDGNLVLFRSDGQPVWSRLLGAIAQPPIAPNAPLAMTAFSYQFTRTPVGSGYHFTGTIDITLNHAITPAPARVRAELENSLLGGTAAYGSNGGTQIHIEVNQDTVACPNTTNTPADFLRLIDADRQVTIARSGATWSDPPLTCTTASDTVSHGTGAR